MAKSWQTTKNLSVLPHLRMETKELEQILDNEIDALP